MKGRRAIITRRAGTGCGKNGKTVAKDFMTPNSGIASMGTSNGPDDFKRLFTIFIIYHHDEFERNELRRFTQSLLSAGFFALA